MLTVFFFVGLALSLDGKRSSGLMPHKVSPKLLMTLEENVGGSAQHPWQFLSLQADDLKPLLTIFSLVLLLTSASKRGAFPLDFLLALGGVVMS